MRNWCWPLRKDGVQGVRSKPATKVPCNLWGEGFKDFPARDVGTSVHSAPGKYVPPTRLTCSRTFAVFKDKIKGSRHGVSGVG